MMLYPKIYNINKSKIIMNVFLVLSILSAIICKIVNLLATKDFNWSMIVIIGIVYTWIIVIFALRRHTNISAYVLLEMICSIIAVIWIDNIIGYKAWSVNLALPIIVAASNVAMFVLTIAERKQYTKSAFYHLMIFMISFIPAILYFCGMVAEPIYTIIASIIALATFITMVILCGKELIEATIKMMHV